MNVQELRKKLEEWQKLQFYNEEGEIRKYSFLLTSVVYYLCSGNPQERYSSLDIETLLRPYQN